MTQLGNAETAREQAVSERERRDSPATSGVTGRESGVTAENGR